MTQQIARNGGPCARGFGQLHWNLPSLVVGLAKKTEFGDFELENDPGDIVRGVDAPSHPALGSPPRRLAENIRKACGNRFFNDFH